MDLTIYFQEKEVNSVSKIDELIKEKCPNGVKYLTLGETCDIKTGAGITKKDADKDGIYPII